MPRDRLILQAANNEGRQLQNPSPPDITGWEGVGKRTKLPGGDPQRRSPL